jgi:predicted negative regulator of RcsB-dependent stress response
MPTIKAETSDAALEAQVFWLRYRKEIVFGAIAFVLILLMFAGYQFYRNRHEIAASAALGKAKTVADYEALIQQYGDTPAGAVGYLLLAAEERKQGKLAEANSTLQRFIEKFPRHELVSSARIALAANLDAMGKQDEAVAVYEQIASANAGSFNAPIALLEEARILQVTNRTAEARRICETIMTQYRESYAAMEAAQLLRSLKPKENGAEKASPRPSSSPMISVSPTP